MGIHEEYSKLKVENHEVSVPTTILNTLPKWGMTN
jgi:hypothetical protein